VPVRAIVEAGCDDAAGEHADTGWDCDAKSGHEEDFDTGNVGRVVYVVVACHCTPRGGAAVDDSDKA